MKPDVSTFDSILSHPRELLHNFSQTPSTIRNWYLLPLLRSGAIKGCTLLSVSGKRIRVSSWERFIDYWNSTENVKELVRSRIDFTIKKNEVHFEYKGRRLALEFSKAQPLQRVLFEIYGHFVEGEYDALEVRGKDVVDIGAGLGETCVYFASRGARHVYALEPFPSAFEVARRNIRRNSLESRVTLLNQGGGGASSFVRINERKGSTPASTLHSDRKGRRVRVLTLDEIIEQYRLNGVALKVDCEGCEYGLILNAKDETLAKVDQIVLEYHQGYRRLANRLRHAGFRVRAEAPKFHVSYTDKKKLYMGILFAYR